MQVTETVSDGLKRKYKVVISADVMTARIDEQLTKLQKKAHQKGFRPGKVPFGLLRKQHGRAVVADVLRETLENTSAEVMSEQGVRPAIRPRIEDVAYDEGKDLEYEVAVEVMPEVVPGDFSDYELEKLVIGVTDDDVSDVLERLRQFRATSNSAGAGHPAEDGNIVLFDAACKVEGKASPAGTLGGYTTELGSGSPWPELEACLAARKTGDSFTVELPLPDAFAGEHPPGTPASFDITIRDVMLKEVPDLDDGFAEGLGYAGLDELHAGTREAVDEVVQGYSRMHLKRTLLDRLSDSHSFDVPPSLVEGEFKAIWEQVESASKDGPDQAKDEKELEAMQDEYRSIAERRVRLGLLLDEIARQNDIRVTPEEMQQAVIDQARQHPGREAAVVQYFQENPDAIPKLTAPILEDHVVDRILSEATIADRPVTMAEFAAIERDDDDDETGQNTAEMMRVQSARHLFLTSMMRRAEDTQDEGEGEPQAE